ncbi:hypothetical protein FUAX_10160 [Fulvitalea axinellae]|uniref:Uncharacterized protein n=1 Tax=Fulvitalea axinellae TaxID=1182444 RepID=A0AAU9D2G7_9BACT|nr:hypothetical protein FUAX_10160 [Fulvitalea axinellae]
MKQIYLLAFSFFLLSTVGFAQKKKIDLNQLIRETQVNMTQGKNVALAWWMPQEFWEFSFRSNEAITESQIEEMMGYVRPYNVFVVLKGEIGPLGNLTNTVSPEEMAESMVLKNMVDGSEYKVLGEGEFDANLQTFLSMMKPMFKNMLGKLGENMNFYVFQGLEGDGSRVMDPTRKGKFRMAFMGKKAHWEFPLATFSAPKECPVDKKEMNGTWNYCPWHGKKLEEIAVQ